MSLDKIDDSYDYLLRMPIYSLTKELYEKIKEDFLSKKEEIKILEATDPKDMYLLDLTELKKSDKNFPEISILFMNEEADLIPDFFKEAGAEYPYKIIEIIPFWKVLGSGKDTPGVKYLWNGNEYKYYWGITDNKFDVLDYQKLINKSYSDLKK